MKNTIIDTTKFAQFTKFVPVGEYRVDTKVFSYMNGKEELVLTYQSFIEVKPLGALQFYFTIFLIDAECNEGTIFLKKVSKITTNMKTLPFFHILPANISIRCLC